mmetsp:Transcript_66809/g.179901  ORF Transcript_66809/g.179901 Transcript_66809/m.179901 type:complete len:200 (+) Transcript_66809:836-1435(+)
MSSSSSTTTAATTEVLPSVAILLETDILGLWLALAVENQTELDDVTNTAALHSCCRTEDIHTMRSLHLGAVDERELVTHGFDRANIPTKALLLLQETTSLPHIRCLWLPLWTHEQLELDGIAHVDALKLPAGAKDIFIVQHLDLRASDEAELAAGPGDDACEHVGVTRCEEGLDYRSFFFRGNHCATTVLQNCGTRGAQ